MCSGGKANLHAQIVKIQEDKSVHSLFGCINVVITVQINPCLKQMSQYNFYSCIELIIKERIYILLD